MAEENGFLLSVEKAVRLRPQAPAYRAADGTTMAYGELWKLSDAIAAELAARTDDRERLGRDRARVRIQVDGGFHGTSVAFGTPNQYRAANHGVCAHSVTGR